MLIDTRQHEGLAEIVVGDGLVACPRCKARFQPRRKDQRYCEKKCAKAATRNANRGARSSDTDDLYRRFRDLGLLMSLNERYYGTPPVERFALLRDWLNAARGGDTRLRRVFSKPAYRTRDRDDLRRYCFRKCHAYPPVTVMADELCRSLFECRVWEWVNGSAPEPVTGEVFGGVAKVPPAYEVADQEAPQRVYVRRDPDEFLATIRSLREPQCTSGRPTKRRHAKVPPAYEVKQLD